MAKVIKYLNEISSHYNAVFCDVWGVIHNGVEPYWQACAALKSYKATGGEVILISNSPRPKAGFIEQMDEIGIAHDVYDDVVTSGEVAQGIIAQQNVQRVYHIGPERDLPLFDGSTCSLTSLEEAELIVCTGLFHDEDILDQQYDYLVEKLISRKLTFVCANPDLAVQKGDKIIPCAGALAQIYEQRGGSVLHTGKPHAKIYEFARHCLKDKSQANILAIGDSLRTDMGGAKNQKLDGLLVFGALTHIETANDQTLPKHVTYSCIGLK